MGYFLKVDCAIRNITVEQKDAIFTLFEKKGKAIDAEVSSSGRTVYSTNACPTSTPTATVVTTTPAPPPETQTLVAMRTTVRCVFSALVSQLTGRSGLGLDSVRMLGMQK